MKKILTAAIAATLALGSVGMASAAEAQTRGNDRYEQRQDRRDDRRDDRADRREQRQDQRAYARWQRSEHRYNAGRYTPPRGFQTRTWAYGQRMPASYRSSSYVVRNYSAYGLRRPPSGYQYVRSGNDVVLTAVATGLITAVIAGLFN
ncbi:RcnB family protein [Brevundimonas sp. M20]|uniref:RcnB family protein n=1 Tax=Brevundimonas sp. M20 TaxID=2591463 RepID=UPI001146DCD1|nr:RcnB family protein [Brevundimonas sp. M20]QDH73071.1 RcnB family protein [Brevundimonas sp. M20]